VSRLTPGPGDAWLLSKPSLDRTAHRPPALQSASTSRKQRRQLSSVDRHGFRRTDSRRPPNLRCKNRLRRPGVQRGWNGRQVDSQGRGTQARESGQRNHRCRAKSEDEGRKWLPCRRAPQPTQANNFLDKKLHGDRRTLNPQGAAPHRRFQGSLPPISRRGWHELPRATGIRGALERTTKKRSRLRRRPERPAFILYQHGPGCSPAMGITRRLGF